ncbi:hypothetical protein LIA77_01406 [Sarocladium implicatum]|nr:hypothetical protein LIA77_01406 [Sarocladium implicatum]
MMPTGSRSIEKPRKDYSFSLNRTLSRLMFYLIPNLNSTVNGAGAASPLSRFPLPGLYIARSFPVDRDRGSEATTDMRCLQSDAFVLSGQGLSGRTPSPIRACHPVSTAGPTHVVNPAELRLLHQLYRSTAPARYPGYLRQFAPLTLSRGHLSCFGTESES